MVELVHCVLFKKLKPAERTAQSQSWGCWRKNSYHSYFWHLLLLLCKKKLQISSKLQMEETKKVINYLRISAQGSNVIRCYTFGSYILDIWSSGSYTFGRLHLWRFYLLDVTSSGFFIFGKFHLREISSSESYSFGSYTFGGLTSRPCRSFNFLRRCDVPILKPLMV